MAQRMESVAPPGGVMLSASTARLVDGAAALGEPELVQIKGADKPVVARRLLGMGDAASRSRARRVQSGWSAVGDCPPLRACWIGAVRAMGRGRCGRATGHRQEPSGARGVRDGGRRGVEVFTPSASRTPAEIPFHAVARLLRDATGIEMSTNRRPANECVTRVPDADHEDLLLFDDLLGIADPDCSATGHRSRCASAAVDRAGECRARWPVKDPAVYVDEDAHWIDEVSESMFADFFTVIPQTPSLVLVTYRPEYEGALARVHGAQTIALAPLSDPETAALVADLLGPDPSVVGLGQTIADRAAGNPFFAEEIVRELAERGVLEGKCGRIHIDGRGR